jgi:hypothetical protein
MRSWLSKLGLIFPLLPALAFGADIKISDLPAATSISGSDVVPIVQSSTTKKASFTVQKGLWDTFYQPLDGDLTALAALTGTHNIYYRSAASTWSSVTIGTGLDFTGATLSATGSGSAPSNAHFLTNQAESGLSAEINLGSLSTGLLKGTVSGAVSTISSITDNSSNWDTAFTDRLKWDGGATGLVAATGRNSLGGSTVGQNLFTLTNPSAITFVRLNADNSVSALDAATFRTAIGAGTGGGDFSSNTSTSVDGELLLFSGTAGKTGKRATGTGVVTATSGVYGTVAAPTGTIVGTSDTQTFTNKRNTPRITTITSSATPTINTDNCDAVTITALAAAITSMTTNLSGTPNNFDKLIIRIKDDGTARAITWGTSFEAKGVALPTTTVISKVLTVGFIYDTVTSKWGCVASVQEQ